MPGQFFDCLLVSNYSCFSLIQTNATHAQLQRQHKNRPANGQVYFHVSNILVHTALSVYKIRFYLSRTVGKPNLPAGLQKQCLARCQLRHRHQQGHKYIRKGIRIYPF